MKFTNFVLSLIWGASSAFAFTTPSSSSSLTNAKPWTLNNPLGAVSDKQKASILDKVEIQDILENENMSTAEKALVLDKVHRAFKSQQEDGIRTQEFTPYVGEIEKVFPGCISNNDLLKQVVNLLACYDFTPENTLLATSLCADELARQLEDDFNQIYGNNFNLGGLSGFPFGGNTAFGAMSAHIPDDGSCLIIYGPHVGIAKDGTVGKVERVGIELVDNCCGSAIAASNYIKAITDGDFQVTTELKKFTDFQQNAVQQMILPHGHRLKDAGDDNRMVELPLALYDSQDILMKEIVTNGASGGKKNGYAVLGGIQINTAPDTLDYFLPLRFDLVNTDGEIVESLLDKMVDGQGVRYRQEFASAIDIQDASEEEMEELFVKIDADGSGAITKDELRAFVSGMRQEDFDAMFAKIDADGNENIDLNEFKSFVNLIQNDDDCVV